MPAFASNPLLWWAVGVAIVALLLVLGRLSSRASVAGQLPPDAGPDLKALEKGQEPDITPEDQSQAPPS